MAEEEVKHSKYEKARILGSRALQLSMGAPSILKMEEKDYIKIRYNPIELAKLEYKGNLIPITVRRPMPKDRL
jgi:DNA-directed RNA polymerase subunit K/omega